jgi:large subunit ribosomal protein L4
MELNLYSSKGKKLVKKIHLEDFIFAAKINKPLMRTAIHVYLANQRQATAQVKTRGEVRGGGAKPWRQKGTGRARHGSIRSPIWKGGGVVFGPRKERIYKGKLTKKMKKAAIRSVFSYFAKNKQIIVLEGVDFGKSRFTKQLVYLTEKLPVGEKTLYIQKGNLKSLYLGSRNLSKINVLPVNEVNVYDLLNHKSLIILKDALEEINKFWGKREKKRIEETGKEETREKKVSSGKGIQREGGSIEGLKLSSRVQNALLKSNIKSKEQLVNIIKKGEKIKGVGDKSLEEIRKILKLD